MHFHLRAEQAAQRVLGLIAEAPAEPVATVVPSRKRNLYRTVASFATAAAVLVGAGAYLNHTIFADPILAERQPQTIARLADQKGAQWLDAEKFPIGHGFVEGDSVYLTKGSAQISMSSGADLVLRAPCFVTLSAADRVQLEEGAVTAQVAEWGRGFKVLTEALQVEDLGTKFAVSVAESGATEVHVLDGQVRIHPSEKMAAARCSVLLESGKAMRVESQQNVTRWMDANRDLYDVEMGAEAPFKPIPIFNTGQSLEVGDEDPNWRVTSGPRCAQFDPQHSGGQFAVVSNADQRYLPNDSVRSQWISVCNPVRPGVPQNTEFVFETSFDLTGYDISTVTIAAQIIADNGIRSVRVNGVELPISQWELNEPYQVFNRFVMAPIDRGLVAGRNKIEFTVWNGVDRLSSEPVNPLALRVEWQAFGRPQAPRPQELGAKQVTARRN